MTDTVESPGVSLDAFDSKTNANKGVEIQLKNVKTGLPMPAFITVLGMDSDTFQEIRVEKDRMLLERAQSNNAQPYTTIELRAMTCNTLARCTVGWRGLNSPDGKVLIFSVAEAEKLYNQYPAIREQIDRAMAERSNFLLA